MARPGRVLAGCGVGRRRCVNRGEVDSDHAPERCRMAGWKAERLVNLVALLLATRRPLTLDQITEVVPGYDAAGEALRRMFERDKDELRKLGVPIERGPVDPWGNERSEEHTSELQSPTN